MPQQQILGIQRVLQTNTAGQTWNNKKLRWSIVHNFDNQSKPYDIELQMVLVSSKRIIKVNQQVKDTQMCSFGYKAKFDISDKLQAEIKQDSLSFQLFVNGKSFTELQEKNHAYQPPKLDVGGNNFWEKTKNHGANQNVKKDINFKTFKQPQQILSSKDKASYVPSPPEPKKTLSKILKPKSTQFNTQQLKQEAPSLQLRHKPLSMAETTKEKKETENVIKDTQSELMKILMQEKKRRKQQEQKLKMNQL